MTDREQPGRARFKTRDLALATYLNLRGHRHSRMERLHAFGYWFFDRDASLDKLVMDYKAGVAKVEPREFVRTLASVREELFAFLNGAPAGK